MSAVHPYSAFLLASVMQSSLVDERSLSYHIILSHYYPIRKDPLCNLISSFSHCCCCLCYCCRFFFSFSLSRCRPKKKKNKKKQNKKKREKERRKEREKEREKDKLSYYIFSFPDILGYWRMCSVDRGWIVIFIWYWIPGLYMFLAAKLLYNLTNQK